MHAFVEVAINLPQIDQTYHYHLTPDLSHQVQVGSLVIVPFGRQKVQGVVINFIESPEVSQTKAIDEVVDDDPVLTPEQIQLARWMADETLSSLGVCINLLLPPGMTQHADSLVSLNRDREIDISTCSAVEKRIIKLLQTRGELRGRQIDAAIRQIEWRGSLKKLTQRGIVHTRAILPPPSVRPKTVRTIALAVAPEKVEHLEVSLSRVLQVDERRKKILNFLASQSQIISPAVIFNQLGGNEGDIKALQESGWVKTLNTQVWRDPLEDWTFSISKPPQLTHDQQAAWHKIQAGLDQASSGGTPKPILLFGVTGSGKTELYFQAVQSVLAEGKRALILVPEISLTPQTVKRFMSRFPGEVGVIHSQLSEGERYDTWCRIRRGELSVVIGPRSALFMPIKNLGLVVVDECHHDSYDQQDQEPFYRGASTAVALAELYNALIILGSATPQVTQYYKAESGQWTRVDLPKRILAHQETIAKQAKKLGIELPKHQADGDAAYLGLPEVIVVDMRQELQNGNRSVFSRDLQSAIDDVLKKGQQAMLFLNRRGSATYVFCRDCGYVAKCPRDDKPLTFHQGQNQLTCHTCGYHRRVPKTCPQCGGHQIKQLGVGTEKIQQLVEEEFPQAKTIRWDLETTRKKGAHQKILERFINQEADILIGTQMLSKGLDLPLVTLVGVILAEVGLFLPDYRATERTFQVLTQVAGRAGRSPLGGQVIMQTYEPGNYAIQAAAKHDFEAFYQQEMAYRRTLGYPPFTTLVRMEYRHHDSRKAEKAAVEMADLLQTWIKDSGQKIDLIGPAPCFFSRLYGRYRWQIILRGKDPANLLKERKILDWSIEVNPASLL